MIIYAIALTILGLCAAPSLILSKRPDAKVLFDKISPIQGWLGVFFFIYGIWGIIDSLFTAYPGLTSSVPILWFIHLFVVVVMAALGFIMGFSLIDTYALSKNPTTEEKGQKLLKKLKPLQHKIGIAATIIGILAFIGLITL